MSDDLQKNMEISHGLNEIDAAWEYESSIPVENKSLLPMMLSDLFAKDYQPVSWIVEKLIPAEGITIVSGNPGSYKTWLLLYMIIKISQGKTIFENFSTKRVNVLLIDEENHPRLIRNRISKLTDDINLPIYILSMEGIKIAEQTVKKILKICVDEEIKLLVIDSFIRIHNADENDAGKISQVFSLLRQFCKEGITVVCTHHHRKGKPGKRNYSQEMRGSSDILASVDCHLAIESNKEKKIITVRQTKLREEQEIPAFDLSIASDEYSVDFGFVGQTQELLTKKDEAKIIILKVMEMEKTILNQNQIIEAVKNEESGLGEKSIRTALEELVKEGKLYLKRGEKRTLFYGLEKFEETTIDQLFQPP